MSGIVRNRYPNNATAISENGVRLRYNGTMWKDMVADLFSKRLNGTTGKVDYDWDNNAIKFQADGDMDTTVDRVQGNQEINHEFLVGDDIVFKPHIHWFQKVGGDNTLDPTRYTLEMRWRIARNGYGINLTTPSWTTIELNFGEETEVFDNSNLDGEEYMCQISRFPDIVVDCGISDTIQFQMTRTDSEGDDLLVYFFDLHGAVDGFGSEEEINKWDY